MESAYIIRQKDRDYNNDFIAKDTIKLWLGKMDILYFWAGKKCREEAFFGGGQN